MSSDGLLLPSAMESGISRDLLLPVYELEKAKVEYFEHLERVERFPHDGQKPILKRLFDFTNPPRKVFCQCSRNFGKSTLAAIWSVGMCIFYRQMKWYIIAPFLTLGKEIYIESGELERMIPPERLDVYMRTESRFKFTNQSFLKMDGADQEARVRGYKPTGLVADEFQDWKKVTWDAMEPNLLAHNAPALQIGTPPDRENVYTQQADEVREHQKQGDNRYMYFHRTIYDNPRLSPEYVETLRRNLINRKEEAIWEREYLAKFIPGGASSVYPMFRRDVVVRQESKVHAQLARRRRYLQPYTVFDPSGRRFGAVGFLYDEVAAIAWIAWSIAETDPNKLPFSVLWPRIEALEQKWYADMPEPVRIYDEAAKLWSLEWQNHGVDMIPTQKKQNEKNNSISLVRDMLAKDRLRIIGEQEDLIWEFENYHYEESGKIHKKNDDLMDPVEYFAAESGYSTDIITSSPVKANIHMRGHRPVDEFEDTVSELSGIGSSLDIENIFAFDEEVMF